MPRRPWLEQPLHREPTRVSNARPTEVVSTRASQGAVLVLLALSAAAFAVAPAVLPPTYSWVRHSISESAAQGLEGAWVTRTGFLLFGCAVLGLAVIRRPRWGRWGTRALGTFGGMMFATAAYAHRPWLPGTPFDATEDLLHSATATIMGAAFAGGVLLAGVERRRARWLDRTCDGMALLASVVIPLAMSQSTAYAGLLQRGMFLTAYVWYGREALDGAGPCPDTACGKATGR